MIYDLIENKDVYLGLGEKYKKAFEFIKESIEVNDKCKKCSFYPLCRQGGCKRNRESGDYCSSYMKFFSSCLPLFRMFRR